MRFQRCPIAPLDSYAGPITMLDGRRIDSDDLTFDRESMRFSLSGIDVTNNIKQADKVANFPGFDRAKDNERAYVEAYVKSRGQVPPSTGSTSTLGIFTKQITTEPLAAPLESLDKTVGQIARSSGVQTIIITAIIGYGLYLYFQSRR